MILTAAFALLALLLLLLLGVLVELSTIWRARAPLRPASIRLGPPADAERPIPRIVWSYWDTLPPPAFVDRCVRLWRHLAPDHEVRLLDRAAVSRWLGEATDAAAFDRLPAYRQADWLRLQLLILHGGVWMDGSTLLTQGLDWVHRLHAGIGSGVVGFWIDRYTVDPQRPVVENWFLAAPPGDPFLRAWADELDRALALGEDGYVRSLRDAGELDALAQGIPADLQAYLVMHLAAGRVLRRTPGAYRLILQRAEDVAFAFHAALRWRKRHLYARLALLPAPRHAPALIKLRSGDRAVVERGLARGLIWRRSLLARLLDAVA